MLGNPIYGSTRIGMANTQARIVNIVRVETVSSNTTITVSEVKVDKAAYYGNKRYEMVGNTGSVHVVISDRKIVTSSGISADILEVNDYYAWGQEIKSRSWSDESERYLRGYQGMLLENTINGEANMYSTEFRMFDARLGRWLSLDALMDQFPWMSPFVGMDNNPISLTDPLGLNTIEKDTPAEPEVSDSGDNEKNKPKPKNKPKNNKSDYGQEIHYSLETTSEVADKPTIVSRTRRKILKGDGSDGVYRIRIKYKNEEYRLDRGGSADGDHPYATPSNFYYWYNNQHDFKNSNGRVATFDEVFPSQSEVWEQIGAQMMLEAAEMLGAGGDTPPCPNCPKPNPIEPEKTKKWKYNFPARTEIEIKEAKRIKSLLQQRGIILNIPNINRNAEDDNIIRETKNMINYVNYR